MGLGIVAVVLLVVAGFMVWRLLRVPYAPVQPSSSDGDRTPTDIYHLKAWLEASATDRLNFVATERDGTYRVVVWQKPYPEGKRCIVADVVWDEALRHYTLRPYYIDSEYSAYVAADLVRILEVIYQMNAWFAQTLIASSEGGNDEVMRVGVCDW